MEGSVRKRGKKWYYSFDLGTIDGKRKRIERVGGNTKKEALESLRKALLEIDSTGTYKDETNISFSEFMDTYMEQYVKINCKYTTQKNYENMIENHLRKDLGFYKLKSISPSILQKYFNDKQKEGYSEGFLRNFKGLLSGMFKYAVYPCQYLKENPTQYIKIPKYDIKTKEKKVKTITVEQFEEIIHYLSTSKRQKYNCIEFMIAFHTGLRSSEVCGLTWDNIDFENKTLTVDKTLVSKKGAICELQSPKTTTSYRTIAIGDTLITILRKVKKAQLENRLKYGTFYNNNDEIDFSEYEYSKAAGFVCREENGKCITTNKIKRLSQTIEEKLNFDFSFHMLRHTHATLLIEAGANMKDVQERLGHSDLSTTMNTYAHVTEKTKRNTVDIFENALN